MTARVPPLLEPYIDALSRDSLILLTSTIGNSTNWLLVQYLKSALSSTITASGRGDESAGSPRISADNAKAVLLVSWQRDWEFWRVECRRAGGPDILREARRKRFVFLDGLTGLFEPEAEPQTGATTLGLDTGTQPVHSQPLRGLKFAIPAKPSEHSGSGGYRVPTSSSSPVQAEANANLENNTRSMRSVDLTVISQEIRRALETLPNEPGVLLVLDGPDLLLSLAPEPNAATAFSNLLLSLRRLPSVHSMIVTASCSLAFPFSASVAATRGTERELVPTKLENQIQAFLTASAHAADLVLGLRPLDTGSALDVTGVIRATKGHNGAESLEIEKSSRSGGEWLYFVNGDGLIKVWERKAGVG